MNFFIKWFLFTFPFKTIYPWLFSSAFSSRIIWYAFAWFVKFYSKGRAKKGRSKDVDLKQKKRILILKEISKCGRNVIWIWHLENFSSCIQRTCRADGNVTHVWPRSILWEQKYFLILKIRRWMKSQLRMLWNGQCCLKHEIKVVCGRKVARKIQNRRNWNDGR